MPRYSHGTAPWGTDRALLPSVADEWNWQSMASCLGYPPEMFFPKEECRGGRFAREQQAKRICRTCPVVAECRQHALSLPETHGIWGAMTARERAHLSTVSGRRNCGAVRPATAVAAT